MKITVKIKNVYGVRRIYPICNKARIFANIANTTTLTETMIKQIELLGYTIELEKEVFQHVNI